MPNKSDLPFSVRRIAKTVTVVDVTVAGREWSQEFLLSADRHFDNPDSDLALQHRHLKEAVERRAGVLDFGDMVCGMQGKFDKRSSKSKLRDEEKAEDYLDQLVSSAVDEFHPYAKNFVVIGRGNHETSILKRCETDISTRIVEALNLKTGSVIAAGGYSGFVKFCFQRGKQRQSIILYYHHGSGGGGVVTKGMIQTNRRAAHVIADIYVSGHIHESFMVEIPRTRLTSLHKIEHQDGWHVQVPSYKEEYREGDIGFHVERGCWARPVGAWWMRFYYDHREQRVKVEFLKARN